MPSRPGAVVSIAQPSRNRDKLRSAFTNPESALMSASPFEIKDYRQPLVTSLGVILGFLLGFLGGLIALLTPCVFPMIPVTVSFFTKRSGNRPQAIRNGVLYGFFIFLTLLAY